MLSLPHIQQKSLLQALITKGAFDTLQKENHILDFISKIWDIDLLPSTDSRFKTMRGDIQQHYINNNDWDEHYMFSEILGIYKSVEKFQKVIELIPSDEFQSDKHLITSLVELINSYLIPHKQRLFATSQQGFIVYELRSNTKADDILSTNTIPFFVERNSNKRGDHQMPEQFPAFVLAADLWDDFGVKSLFRLFYYSSSENQKLLIGAVKIIVRSEKEDDLKTTTKEYLDPEFKVLPAEFCSLGQEQEYYENIKKVFPDDYRSILGALRDCAIFPTIEDDFEKDYSFGRSLLRDNEAERLLRDAKYLIEGIKVTNRERFIYHFQSPYAEDKTKLDVEFDSKNILPSRLLAIVGKNGVGKTQLLSCLPRELAQKRQDAFEPQVPLFSRVISISTSLHDHCDYPENSNDFNYEYIGLTVKNAQSRKIITEAEIDAKLQEAGKRINRRGRASNLREILSEILPLSVIETLFQTSKEKWLLNINVLSNVRKMLSSGESTLFYIFSCIVASLRYDTLLLFDEPETHLHPNAITTLMSALYRLIEDFQSYALVATHSPLVIREVKSSQVRVMERIENKSVVRKVHQETLGANVSALVDEIFGNKDIPKFYRKAIIRLVKEGYTMEDIYKAIGSEANSLPIGLQIFINSINPQI